MSLVTIDWAEETLTLLPERALWWARQRTLFIADPHFGKASVFRSAGIPVPELAHADDLVRLGEVVRRFDAKKLVILGDFFHAKVGRSKATLTALAAWREAHSELEMTLVLGNHDRHAGHPPEEWRIQSVKGPWALPPFTCCHEPESIKDKFVLAGHWHPSFRLHERSGSGLRSPCFYFTRDLAVLPAFGSFTGCHPVQPKLNEKIFLVGPDEVIEVYATG